MSAMNGNGESWNTQLIGHTDLNGFGDGMHVNVRGQYAYVGHMGESRIGTSIVDISDRRAPKVVNQLETPVGTHSHKVQIVDDLLLVNYERNHREKTATSWKGGLKVFDLSGDPVNPREIAFYEMPGAGVHRMTFWEGPYATMSGSDEGYSDQFFIALDLSNPEQPVETGRWWFPGMHAAGGETPDWGTDKRRVAFHHAIVRNERAYCGFWDAGMVILDISDMSTPTLVSHLDFGSDVSRSTHTVLPIPSRGIAIVVDEETVDGCQDIPKQVRVVDIEDEKNPREISKFPVPQGDFCVDGARFGPHNLHEMRPGSYQSDATIFLTYFSAGLRIIDLSDPLKPAEVGYFVPSCPPGQPAPQLNDVYVHNDGTVFVTDRYNGGLYLLEVSV